MTVVDFTYLAFARVPDVEYRRKANSHQQQFAKVQSVNNSWGSAGSKEPAIRIEHWGA